ncbi:MAG TPA: methyltransferase domain-containing protein [Roseiflexaceae bacterium]|nr:methyltransferase domain-containing protein [Roseiflexaceae bacterium]
MPRRYQPGPRRPPADRSRRPPPRPAAHGAPRQAIEADVLEGLERIAQAELSERFGGRVRFETGARVGALHFSYAGDLSELLALRSVVAVYLVRRFAIPRPKALLGNQQFGELAGAISSVLELAPPRTYATLRLSAAGEDSTVLTRLKSELAQRFGLAVAADEGDLLIRLRRARDADGWETLVRLTPRPLATRIWRVCNLPGALNASLAYAMIALTEPATDDVVLNLACGSGTLLIERLISGRVRQAIGCDTDAAALDCARENVRAAGFERAARLESWDAGRTPLDEASVSMICADLPFGQLVGSHRENQEFYPRVFAEAARVARPGARMVLLTHEVRLLDRTAERFAREWRPLEALRVRSGGMTPAVALFRRTSIE